MVERAGGATWTELLKRPRIAPSRVSADFSRLVRNKHAESQFTDVQKGILLAELQRYRAVARKYSAKTTGDFPRRRGDRAFDRFTHLLLRFILQNLQLQAKLLLGIEFLRNALLLVFLQNDCERFGWRERMVRCRGQRAALRRSRDSHRSRLGPVGTPQATERVSHLLPLNGGDLVGHLVALLALLPALDLTLAANGKGGGGRLGWLSVRVVGCQAMLTRRRDGPKQTALALPLLPTVRPPSPSLP